MLGGVLLLTGVGALAWHNAGSRNLVFAATTLLAAVVLFCIQLPFELRRSTERDLFAAEFTIDRAAPSIRQWRYTGHTPWRVGFETQASSWLFPQKPSLLDSKDGRRRITADFTLLSIVGFIAATQYDWQLRSIRLAGDTTGTLLTWQRLSKSGQCTSFDNAAAQQLLKGADNAFAGAELPFVAGPICLPPNAVVEMTRDEVTIRTPYCTLHVAIPNTLPSETSYTVPGTGGDVPTLPDGSARYETRLVGLEVTTTFHALRSQHRDAGRYRDWATRFVGGLREWFSPKD